MGKGQITKILRWAGIAVSMIGIAFVVVNISKYTDQLGSLFLGGAQYSLLTLLALVYGCTNLALAAAWRSLLAHSGSRKSFSWAVRVFGISQLAKYVPGNVLHLAGRQAMGMSGGARTSDLAKSAAWELGTIAVTAGLFSVLLAPLFVEPLNNLHSAVLFAATLVSVAFIARKYLSTDAMLAVLLYACFFLISGLIFVAILVLLGAGNDNLMTIVPSIVGAYVVAWLAGFATPGAPAGVGIREAVLFGVLQSEVSHAGLLAAIVLSRVVTTLGDLFFYVLAHFAGDDR